MQPRVHTAPSLTTTPPLLTTKTWTRIISVALIITGGLVLLGWLLNIAVLKSILPGLATMKANTALSFLLAGLSLWLIQTSQTQSYKRLAQVCAFLVLVIGSLTLIEYRFGWTLGIDQLLFKDTLLLATPDLTGRMSEATAFGFMLLGSALLLMINTRRYVLTQLCALLVLGLGLLAFTGYLFGISSLYSILPFSTVALHTATAFFVGGLGVLFASSHAGPIAEINRNYLGGVMARRLLPAVFLVPLVIGWLRLQGQFRGYYDTEFGAALLAVSNIIIITIVVWWTARLLNRIDVENKQAAWKLERYGRRMEILHNIDRGIIGSQDTRDIALATFKELRLLVPCQRISLKLVDEATQELVIYAADSAYDPVSVNRIPFLPTMLEGFDADHTRLIDDLRLRQDDVPLADEYLKRGLTHLFQVLLVQDGSIQGLISLASSTADFFIPEYRQMAVEVSNQLAIAIKQANLSDSLQKSNRGLERYARRMEILHNIDRGIMASRDTRDIALATFMQMRVLIPCQRISLKLADETTQELVIYATDSQHDPLSVDRIPFLPQMFEGFDADHTRLIDDLRLRQDDVPLADEYLKRGLTHLFQVLLVHDDAIQGVVSLASRTPDFFVPEYREMAVEVSNQLAIAIKQANLSDSLQKSNRRLERYARRMEILHDIDRGIISSRDTKEIAEATFKELRLLIPCQRIGLILIDETTQELTIYAADSDYAPLSINRATIQPQMLEGFDEHNSRLIEDLRLRQDHVPLASEYIEQGLITLLQVLLVRDGETQGIVTLAATTPDFFTSEYRQMAIEIAHQMAIAFKQMRLTDSLQKSNRRLERYARRMEILHNIDRGIIGSQDTREIATATFKQLRVLVPCQRISLKLVDEATQELVIYAAASDDDSISVNRIPFLPTMLEGFDTDHTRLIDDLRLRQDDVPLANEYLKRGLTHLFQVLLVQGGVIQGLVSLASSTPDFFIPEYREMAVEVSDQLAIAIKQMRLSEALQKSNETLEQRVIKRTAELNASKEQVETILNNSLDAIVLTNANLVIQKTNPAFERLFAQIVGESKHISLPDLIHAEDAKRVTTIAQKALTGISSNAIEVRAHRQNGATFEAELSIGHIEGDGLVTTLRDITARKVIERQMRYHASIQNTVADAVIATDLEFHIQSWNKAAERIYGWREKEVLGKRIVDVLQTEYVSRDLTEEIRRVFIEQGHWSGEVMQRRRDGTAIYILSSTVLFKDSNNVPFGVLAINHDITERKLGEQALQSALDHEKEVGELKTRFISIASHEFRTPLTAILMAAESIKHFRHKMEPEKIDRKLDGIHRQVMHMTAILEDVLESARLQGDYVDFKPMSGNFDAICQEIVEEFAQRQEFANRIRCTSEIPDLLSHFDARLVRQIMINLLSNALKYSPPDSVVQVDLTQKDGQIILEVSDHGIGIPQADLKFIFEPFHRASNVGRISGTGLGMNVTKKAVEVHEGSIHVMSEPNTGTTFTVVIPIATAANK